MRAADGGTGAGAGWATASSGALVLVGALLGVASRTTLWDRDEPRFAVATIEMVQSGNYLFPTFNGAVRPDKPIMIYWLMSVPARLFGTGEVALRAVSAIAMAIAAFATYAAGRWLFNPRTGLLAAAILVTTPLALVEGSAATADALLLAWITIALAAFAHAFVHGWRFVHGASLAFAFGGALMTKGLVGLVLPLTGIAAAWWMSRGATALKPRDAIWLATAAGLGVGAFLCWAIPATAATAGELARGGVGHHTLRRMFEPLEGHGGSFVLYLPYYVVVVALAFFPWTLFLGGAISAVSSGRLGRPACGGALLLGWTIPTLIIMTLVATKLPHYILPIWPALALAVAATIDAQRHGALADRDLRWLRHGAWFAAVGAALIGVGLMVLPRWLPAAGLLPWAWATGLMVLMMTGLAIREQRRGRVIGAARVLLIGMIAVEAALTVGVLPALDRLKPSPPLATAIRAQTAVDVPVVTRGYAEPTLVYYLRGRSVRALADDSAAARWSREPGAGVMVTPRDIVTRLDAPGLREIASVRGYNFGNGRWVELVALSKPAAGAASGSQSVNALPRPTVLSTVISPSWSSASSRAMARPSPVPPSSRLRD